MFEYKLPTIKKLDIENDNLEDYPYKLFLDHYLLEFPRIEVCNRLHTIIKVNQDLNFLDDISKFSKETSSLALIYSHFEPKN